MNLNIPMYELYTLNKATIADRQGATWKHSREWTILVWNPRVAEPNFHTPDALSVQSTIFKVDKINYETSDAI